MIELKIGLKRWRWDERLRRCALKSYYSKKNPDTLWKPEQTGWKKPIIKRRPVSEPELLENSRVSGFITLIKWKYGWKQPPRHSLSKPLLLTLKSEKTSTNDITAFLGPLCSSNVLEWRPVPLAYMQSGNSGSDPCGQGRNTQSLYGTAVWGRPVWLSSVDQSGYVSVREPDVSDSIAPLQVERQITVKYVIDGDWSARIFQPWVMAAVPRP